MRIDVYKKNKKVMTGNLNMLNVYTDEEIKAIYKKLGYEVKIER